MAPSPLIIYLDKMIPSLFLQMGKAGSVVYTDRASGLWESSSEIPCAWYCFLTSMSWQGQSVGEGST